MKVSYPDSFPLESVTNVVKEFRAGTVRAHMDVVALDLWNIQGYAQKQLVGSGAGGGDADDGEGDSTDATVITQSVGDPLDTLEKLAADHQSGVAAQALFDWKWLALWAAEQLLALLKEKLS